MSLASLGWLKSLNWKTALAGLLFVPLSVLVFLFFRNDFAELLVGFLACLCVVSACYAAFAPGESHPGLERMCVWTMPVYLMHTIFAAGLRVVLIKLGVTSALIHIPLGLAIGFIGPVIAIIVMERLKPLDFLVYPNRYIKIGRSRG